MVSSKPTVLEYALLGLTFQQPRSGYALRKVFATTPMGHYSSSPGAIYPALKRLEERGLLEGSIENPDSLRPSRVYRPTKSGLAVLSEWLQSPVDANHIVHDMPELMLRFALMPGLVDDVGTLRFLDSLTGHLRDYVTHLDAIHASMGPEVPLHSRLALENGIRGYRSHLDWGRNALETFRTQARSST